MSIRFKLFALLLALGTAAAAVGLFTTWVAARRTVREQAVARFAGLADAWHTKVANRLREAEGDVRRLATDTRYSSCMGQASADPLDFAGAPGDVRAANLCLTQLALHTRWGNRFVLLNDRGLQIIREEDEQRDIGKSWADRSIVQQALKASTALDVSPDGKELDVAAPVVSPEGRLLGVAIAGISLDTLLESLGQELEGVTVAPTHGAPGAPEEIRSRSDDRLAQTVSLTDLQGHPLLAVRLERDLGSALRPFEHSILNGALWGGFGSLVLALLLGVLAAGRATRPLRELAAGTEAVARGDYSTRVSVGGDDELGQVARGFNAMAEGLGLRVFFEAALRRYLAPAVVEDLIRDPGRMELGGERREMTVLFFDVAGFTTLSEALPPDALVALCNGYLEKLVGALFQQGGTLDKFIGDAVMALFGVPLAQPDHAARASLAALAMQKAFVEHVAASPFSEVRGLRGRVGIHTGIAAFGNLGSQSIMSLTAMGDAVNLASRLEGVNKLYGTSILASAATVRHAAGAVQAREIDRVRVVGRKEPVEIFELLAGPPSAAAARYAEGLAAYRARRFVDAEAAFQAAVALGDSPAAIMLERATAFRHKPPQDGWDGSFALDHK